MRTTLVLLLAPLVAGSGCAAAKATYHLVDAEQAILRAEQHQAPEYAVYEYTMAQRYLEKAREEAGYADYGISVDLSRRSAEWADRAIIAIEGEGRRLDLDGVDELPDRPARLPSDRDIDALPDQRTQTSTVQPTERAPLPSAESDWDLPDDLGPQGGSDVDLLEDDPASSSWEADPAPPPPPATPTPSRVVIMPSDPPAEPPPAGEGEPPPPKRVIIVPPSGDDADDTGDAG